MGLIYVVDDDENLCEILSRQLTAEGYRVETFLHAQLLIDRFQKKPCDLIISDIMMPDINGYDLCREIRSISDIPFIMLSAKNEEIDRVLGLELGSDDYITKPFSLRELSIKVKNMLRRYQRVNTPSNDELICMDLKLDIKERSAWINHIQLELTTKEFNLLELFLMNKSLAFSREQLIEKVWGYDYYGDTRQVDHMIKRIRKKLLAVDAEFRIQTVWGFGYKVSDI